MFESLPGMIKEAARAKPGMAKRWNSGPQRINVSPRETARPQRAARMPELIAIGSSTGGVEALMQVLSEFPADCPPTLIVQHLPAAFTTSFAARLDRASRATVVEAKGGESLMPGHIYLAPGGERHMLLKSGSRPSIALVEGATVSGHRPSVDVLFSSIAKGFKGEACGLILTGMGRDGAQGLLEMRQSGAQTLGQDEETSLVYGMPRVAFEIGAVTRQLPLNKVAKYIFS